MQIPQHIIDLVGSLYDEGESDDEICLAVALCLERRQRESICGQPWNKHLETMTLEQTIQQAIMESIKAKDTVAMNATRAIKGEILLFRTAGHGKEISDQDILCLIQKLIKQRKEASEVYLSAGRKDLSDNELSEAAVMERFLPRQLSEEEIKERVREIILQSGASTLKEMGKVMGIASKALAGVADGRAISSEVKRQLSAKG